MRQAGFRTAIAGFDDPWPPRSAYRPAWHGIGVESDDQLSGNGEFDHALRGACDIKNGRNGFEHHL